MSTSQTFSVRFSVFGNEYDFTPHFTLATVLLIVIFVNLGCWQLDRAHAKYAQAAQLAKSTTAQPITLTQLNNKTHDYRYTPIQLQGTFDNAHSFLVDNRIHQGQVGYEIITPFRTTQSNTAILVNRGWIPQGTQRDQLPHITPSTHAVSLRGILLPQPEYFALGPLFTPRTTAWPRLIQHIDIAALATQLPYPLYPYLLSLDTPEPLSPSPAQHLAYATQWFGFAGILVILFIILNVRRVKDPQEG